MPAPGRRMTPWIENLILSYGREEGISVGQLKAHVVGEGHMSQSQAQRSEDHTGVLYLSDEHVQIPAILTASAWEELQEQEDLECLSTLITHTVCIKDYRLVFHMTTEQTQSGFFLSVGKLVTISVGTKDQTPSCISLLSVQRKICQTWYAMLGQDDSQKSQTGLNLTDLLGEWQQDCLLTELEHVREKLSTATPHPSTSTMNPTVSLPDTSDSTSWDVDAVRYKGVKSFTVPIQQLLIPKFSRQVTAQQQRQTGPENVSTESTETFAVSMHQEVFRPDINNEKQCASEGLAVFLEDQPLLMTETYIIPKSNPWDMCPPPSSTSSTQSSPEAIPAQCSILFTETTTNHCPVVTSTQCSALFSKSSSTELTAEPSLFPPYQRPQDTTLPLSSSNSSGQSANTMSNLSQAADPSSSTQETSNQPPHSKRRRPMKKRSVPPIEDQALVLDESQVEEVDSSPPSWLFDSQISSSSTSEKASSESQSHTVEWLPKVAPSVHSDGKPFSYSYQVKGQDLLHFSRFTVQRPVLEWAVRYLLRPQHNKHKSAGATDPGMADNYVTLS